MLGWIAAGLLLAALAIVHLPDLLIALRGDARLTLDVAGRTPLRLDKREGDVLTASTTLTLANAGRQCGSLMDCFARTLLPYEQYDGVAVSGRVERGDCPRDDDYFEAMTLDAGQSCELRIVLTLAARRGLTLESALAQMVDLPVDVVTVELTRRPWHMGKQRVQFPATELAGLVGVKPIDLDHVKGCAALCK